MDAATAWAEAMKFANRPNPYPFYDELRRTPVAKVSDKTYVVTGFPEVLALAHDPRISVDVSRSPSGFFGEKTVQLDPAEAAQNRNLSMLVTDPPEHDRMRRQFMRHFGPPHTPDLIPSLAGFVVDKANELLDAVKARGTTRMDVVEDFSYPIPVSVIFRVLGDRLHERRRRGSGTQQSGGSGGGRQSQREFGGTVRLAARSGCTAEPGAGSRPAVGRPA
jgi:cytochrome P450